MKKLITSFSFGSLLLLPVMASAQIVDSGNAGPFEDLLINIVTFINDILIPFIIAIGFLVFVWGMFRYFIAGGANDEAKQSGKSLMIWATLGFVLIIVFWGVINLIASSTGLDKGNIENIPTADVFGA